MLPKVCLRACLLTLLFVCLVQSNPHYEAIQRLHADVLKGYNSQVIPLVERGTPLTVSTSLTLTTLEFDEANSRFAAKGFYLMRWTDPRLAWNPETYDGVSSIRLPPDAIWKPDLEVYNVQGKLAKERIFASTVSLAMYNGTVIYVPLNSFDAICSPDATRYPYDEVTCTIIVGSWTHSTENIRLLTDGNAKVIVEYLDTKQTQGWELVSNSIVSKEKIYDCCPNDPYQSLEYNFVIKRKAPSAVFAITVPAILISLLTLGSLLIPVQTSSRLIVGMINLLLTCSYLLYFHTNVPTAGSAPLVVQYFGALAILVTISVLQAALGIRLVSCQPEQNNGSKNFLKRIFFSQSVRLLTKNAEKDNAANGIGKSSDENSFIGGGEGATSWITVFLTIDRWMFVVYIVIIAALIKAYLI